MTISKVSRVGLRRRWLERLPRREILVRSNGDARVVIISTTKQLLVMGALAILLLAVCGGIGMAISAARAEMARLRHEQAIVARRAAAIETYRRSAAGVAQELEERQRLIEALVASRLGPIDAPAKPAKPAPAKTISNRAPDIDQMRRLEARQTGFVRKLVAAFDARSKQVEKALRGLGLDPRAMLAKAAQAQGGPLEPLADSQDVMTPTLKRLADSVARLGMLEDTMMALPSALPTDAQMVTSSYGVRSDPFTGVPAFHPGIDFVGSYGQPITAAAGGTVAFAGQRSGYGNCVEIDHGNGILTRYGHLSGFVARVGETVMRGQTIARMGSTGRSTGTHLHFEVRVDGRAVDPRPFLRAKADGLGSLQSASRQGSTKDKRAGAGHA